MRSGGSSDQHQETFLSRVEGSGAYSSYHVERARERERGRDANSGAGGFGNDGRAMGGGGVGLGAGLLLGGDGGVGAGDGLPHPMREVYSFGQNSYGELAHGDVEERLTPTLVSFCSDKPVVSIACGNEHTAILTEGGTLYTCGYNDSGQCGVGRTGRVTKLREVQALHGKPVVQVYSSNGCEHLAAVTQDGELYTCGYNARGQLGLGSTTQVSTPRVVEGTLYNRRVVLVACSYYHTAVSTDADEVFTFGRNDHGQLGLGDHRDRLVPCKVDALKTHSPVLSLGCGQYHTAIAQEDGLRVCGKNDYGQLGLEAQQAKHLPVACSAPLGTMAVTTVACGYYHTVALGENGLVYVFGRNDYGQLGMGDKTGRRR